MMAAAVAGLGGIIAPPHPPGCAQVAQSAFLLWLAWKVATGRATRRQSEVIGF